MENTWQGKGVGLFMINNLQNAREEWSKRNNKTGVEKSCFQDLEVDDLGQYSPCLSMLLYQ